MRRSSVLLSILLAGACAQAPLPVPIPMPPPVQSRTLTIQPLIVTEEDGDHGWANLRGWDTQVRYAQLVWAEAHLSIEVRPPRLYPREDWRKMDQPKEFDLSSAVSTSIAQSEHVLPVWLVQVVLKDGGMVSGRADYPTSGCGVWIGQVAVPITLAHELGHTLGLPHTWEDNLIIGDTPCTGDEDCDSDPTNIMGYCSPSWDRGPHLSPEQLGWVRLWLASPFRAHMVRTNP